MSGQPSRTPSLGEIRRYLSEHGVEAVDLSQAAQALEDRCRADERVGVLMGSMVGGVAGVSAGIPGVVLLAGLLGLSGGVVAGLVSDDCRLHREIARELVRGGTRSRH
jgi:hypothetical protein